jgi:flagellin-like protein
MFKELFDSDDRGVSPVIGVILMVAITVILAAVIGAFVLGLGDSLSNNAPQASFDFDPGNSGNGAIVMTGGDELDGTNVKVTVGGSTEVYERNTPVVPDPITAGTDLMTNGGSFGPDDTVRVIWTSPNGGNSAVIGRYNA